MQKNVASQKWVVFAFDETDNTAKAGDAGQITAEISIDGAAGGGNITDTNPTELEDGYYVFDLDQGETNGDYLLIMPESSTGDIQVIGVPGAVWTTAPAINTLAISNAIVDANAVQVSGSTTAANNVEVVFDTDFATNYSAANDKWQVESDCLSISGNTTAANNLEVVFDTDFATNYGSNVWQVDVLRISSSATAANNAEIVFDTDFATNYSVANDKWQTESDCLTIEGSDATDQIRDSVVDDSTRIDASQLNTHSAITAAGIVNEWETQSQADPTGFHVNVKEVNGTAQTAGDVVALINTITAVTDDMKVLDTTIATVTTPDTVFTVAAGLTGNDDINNAVCSIFDTTGVIWSGPRRVTDYVHGSLTITIDANTAFPLAAGDRVVIWNVSYATTAAGGSITPGDIGDIVDGVWDELQSLHLTELTMGAKQNVSDRVGR